MRFCNFKVRNLVLKIDLVNRWWVVYSRAYGIRVKYDFHTLIQIKDEAILDEPSLLPKD